MRKATDSASSKILELNTILEKVSSFTLSSIGNEVIRNLPFIKNRSELEKELSRISEMKDLLTFDDNLPFNSFNDLRAQLKRVKTEGTYLRPEEFLSLKNFISMGRKVKTYFEKKDNKYPLLETLIQHLVLTPKLEENITRIIDQSGFIKDNASGELSNIRHSIEIHSSEVKKRLKTILQSMLSHGYAQEGFLVLRDGRSVIPMKENHIDKLKGMVVDQSSSGATLYIEPLEVLEANNEIRRLRIRERDEIEKILIHLTDYLREYLQEIHNNLKIMGQLDSLYARAKFSIEINGSPAGLNEQFVMEIDGARHPILLMKLGLEKVVPLDIKMDESKKIVIITGPNAGGKTVALKTVGLLALMNQIGLHIPAGRETMLPIFSSIFADIGDQQSIEQDLSTFSSHMKTIQTFLNNLDSHSLVLLDEIGASTDPQEGAALATALLSALMKRGGFTLVTTHLGELKLIAHETPGIENGSMMFDHKTLQPTYRFQMGLPGSSYAFEISERLGISKEVINEAKKIIGKERGKLDQLIIHLEQELFSTQKLLGEAEIKESQLSGLVNLYQNQIQQLHKESEERKKEILNETETILKDANKLVERIVREIRERQADKQSIRKAKQEILSLKNRVQSMAEKQIDSESEIVQGDWVLWKNHEGQGQVLSEPDNQGRITVQWNGLKVRIPIVELEVTNPIKVDFPSGISQYSKNDNIRDEIDLRGFTVDEAIESVDKYLSDVSVIGYSQVRVIHGKGTGVLRKEIGKYLRNHRLVKNSRLGSWNEGDTGVTIVDLK